MTRRKIVDIFYVEFSIEFIMVYSLNTCYFYKIIQLLYNSVKITSRVMIAVSIERYSNVVLTGVEGDKKNFLVSHLSCPPPL